MYWDTVRTEALDAAATIGSKPVLLRLGLAAAVVSDGRAR